VIENPYPASGCGFFFCEDRYGFFNAVHKQSPSPQGFSGQAAATSLQALRSASLLQQGAISLWFLDKSEGNAHEWRQRDPVDISELFQEERP
jgi:hypothetical protein